jgi:hypothetical protein
MPPCPSIPADIASTLQRIDDASFVPLPTARKRAAGR